MAVELSLGELEALAVKAARGAGLPWGLASEAGFAVRVLNAAGGPGAACLAGLLRSYPSVSMPRLDMGLWQGNGALCPITLGAALADFATPARTGPVAFPGLLAGAVARLSGPGARLSWESGVIAVASDAGVAASGGLDALVADATALQLGDAPVPAARSVRRARVSDDVLQVLTGFAERTYAPASEASRLSGAGAGLTDND